LMSILITESNVEETILRIIRVVCGKFSKYAEKYRKVGTVLIYS